MMPEQPPQNQPLPLKVRVNYKVDGQLVDVRRTEIEAPITNLGLSFIVGEALQKGTTVEVEVIFPQTIVPGSPAAGDDSDPRSTIIGS